MSTQPLFLYLEGSLSCSSNKSIKSTAGSITPRYFSCWIEAYHAVTTIPHFNRYLLVDLLGFESDLLQDHCLVGGVSLALQSPDQRGFAELRAHQQDSYFFHQLYIYVMRNRPVLHDDSFSLTLFMTFPALPPALTQALARIGISQPTRIQLMALAAPQTNMLLLAKAGTGKTLAYLLPILANQLKYKTFNKTVILVPTRQLAQQVFRVTKRLLQNLGQFKTTLAIGGIPLEQDRRNIKRGMDNIIVGTFGRLIEWLEKGLVQQSQVGHVVIDQVDKFFQQGQQKLTKFMKKMQTAKKQCLMATATCSPQLMEYLQNKVPSLQVMVCEPQSNNPEPQKINLQGLKVLYLKTKDQFEDKAEQLVKVLKTLSYTRCLIFYNSLSEGNKLYARLSQEFQAHFLHSSIGQFARMTLLANITSAPIVVTSDLLARGFDSKDVDLVVQWQFPYLQQDYLHRFGRGGRRGQQSLGLQFGQWKSEKDIKLQSEEYEEERACAWLKGTQANDLRMEQVELQPQDVQIGQWQDFDPQKQADLDYRYYPDEEQLDQGGPVEISQEEILACEHCRRVMREAEITLSYKFVLLDG